jgi:hypothetical protein
MIAAYSMNSRHRESPLQVDMLFVVQKTVNKCQLLVRVWSHGCLKGSCAAVFKCLCHIRWGVRQMITQLTSKLRYLEPHELDFLYEIRSFAVSYTMVVLFWLWISSILLRC